MNTFTTLAEPNRRDILVVLIEGEATVNTLVARVGLSQPSMSKHLKVLRDSELVTQRIDGQRRWYALNGESLKEIDDWLQPFRRLWSQRLDALGEHLDKSAQARAQTSRTNKGE